MYGRQHESKILQRAFATPRAQLGIVYGRRRIGKSTFLKSHLGPKDLYFEGIKGLSKARQIRHFIQQLAEQTQTLPVVAHSWEEAFQALSAILKLGPRYVVFDEFPWMASEKSELVAILKYFWDRHWAENANLTLVLCGSIAQFMVKHVVHSEALHNRKTFEIKLEALEAWEAKEFFQGRRSSLEIAQFLMIFGGVPKYLEQIDPADSLSMNLDRLCFTKSGFFLSEFETLFKEQFKSPQIYSKLVSLLSAGALSRETLSQQLKLSTGGGLTSYLENLERADFIRKSASLDLVGTQFKSKTSKLVLWDEWLRFYFRFVAPQIKVIERQTRPGLFKKIVGPHLAHFFGLGFEQFCFKNVNKLLEGLQIDPSEVRQIGPYFRQAKRSLKKKEQNGETTSGTQIDLLLVRDLNVLTLIECKLTQDPVGLSVAREVQLKIDRLGIEAHGEKRHSVEKVLIAPSGATKDLRDSHYFNQIIGLEAFF